ncbi:uncharacterized protein LOC100679115 [Nasonia vitripennis]|uniref:Nuclear respiratory factor 1 NLS/DNA-binding dimerisation domain-containing protein n=1 Tax=Nasonia vitripennis TaxID=7425 RepID=A0A7M7IUI7_NASVI|nr:uncharacterized protein LOC100679115 [Nasonia vitripennis]XP_003424520.1 uncharacterized protein LOC100679115 [Nasonia vitripennis]XP_003424521.1 uncharacterized protein LOC100679115 [Nasonia vitripennis]XP_016844729.1 uncharacterized protein LOC100679115 [Nasonia vitripennis]XP_031787627.1 uncharacterized protein LOC100679115 [Nasonia vitripennis]
MRFSAVQEDGYRVGLGQETPPTDVDESMMAATGDLEPGGGSAVEEGSMISNLPLLFASGYPTSLEKITLPELERFITFMVQCSLGHDTAEVISEPQWWPKEVKFSIPLVRPKRINDLYKDNLKKLVFRCYTYHRSEYLLRFCSYLAQYPHDKLEYVNNWDSTTSLYLKTNGKLLVTFRNENMNYDRKIEGPRRKLLPLNRTKSNYPNGTTKSLRRRSAQKQAPSPAMVEPPTDDIYLCDNCDAELVGSQKMKEHEKLCYRVEPRPLTPEVEIAPVKQDQFMDYFKLQPTNPVIPNTEVDSTLPCNKDNNAQNRSSSRIRNTVNLTRCPTIPFSSPAGLLLGKKSKMMTEAIQQERLDRIERHLTAPPLSISFKPKWFTKTYEFDRWSVTFKPNRDKTPKSDEYVHKYNFGYTGKPVLDLRSQLLYVSCKPIYVAMERLSEGELEALKRDPSRYKSPERKVPRYRPRSPSVETVFDPLPGDEFNPIIIDLDDDEPSLPPPTPTPPPPAIPSFRLVITNVASVSPTVRPSIQQNDSSATHSKPATYTVRTGVKRSKSLSTPMTTTRQSINQPILYVDLCSSDDEMPEEDQVEEIEVGELSSSSACISTDENRDPIQKLRSPTTASTNVSSYVRSSLLTPTKVIAKPCIYPADSTSNWLANLNTDTQHRESSGSSGFLKLATPPTLKSSP